MVVAVIGLGVNIASLFLLGEDESHDHDHNLKAAFWHVMADAVTSAGAIVALAGPEGGGAFLNAINAKFGTKLGPDDIAAMGIRVLKAEREFNRKAGFTNKDDRLPRFFYEEPLPPHNTVFMIGDEEIDRTFDF